MKFDAYTRRQAQVLFDTVAAHAAESTKKELEALRAGAEARIAALQQSLAHPEHAQLLDRLVQELSAAARADADAARIEAETVAALARGEAQHAADDALAAARADGQAKLAAEQKTNAALRTAVEEAQQKIQKLQAEQSAAHSAAKAAAQAAATAEAAARAAQAAAQAELDRTRKELEGRLEQVQAARAELARVLTEVQREAANARAEAAAHAASLKESQARVQSLEHEYTEILVARDDASTRLEAEVLRVAELKEAMAPLRQEVGLAKQEASLSKVDAEGRRQGLEAATARIRILEEELRKTTEASGQQRPKQAVAQTGKEESGVLLLDHVGTALESIDVAISANEILETLIEQLGRHFASAAVFLVGPSSFKGWKGTGLGAGTDISNIEIPRTIDSLLTRTLAERKPAMVSGKAGEPAVGVLGSPVATALAFPVFANGRVIAVAYAEHAEESSASLSVGCKIAEILIDHANRRLTVKRRSATPGPAAGQDVDRLGPGTNLDARATAYSPARQARRVIMPQALEVTLEGSASILVDLSTLGAQVLSPVAMRPKRAVRMTLPTDEGEVVCKGRVVWTQFEQAHGGTEARYRAGLKFTEADSRAVEAFLARHGGSAHDRVLAANLEESA